MTSVLLLGSVIGLFLNLSFNGLLTQPDWMYAILLAALLSDKSTWYWVLPLVLIHDAVLYWSATITFPITVIIVILLIYSDKRLGSGQQQRWLFLFAGCLPLLIQGISFWDWLLTMMLVVWLWFILSAQRDGANVESA